MNQTSSAETGARVRFPPPLVFVAAILLGVALQHGVTPLRLPWGRAVGITVGVLVALAGLLLGAWARNLFVKTGQSPIPWKPSPELIPDGPYRFTRNPMYVGMTLAQIGVGAALNDFWIVLFAPLALLGVHFIAVLPEEKYLSDKFGEPYRQYLRRVRRYF